MLTEEGSAKDSPSSTLIRESPVVRRLKAVLHVFQQFIETNDDGQGIARFSWLINSITEELAEELSDKDEASMAIYMAQIGQVISWIGHGDNEALPEQLQIFAETVQPGWNGNHEPDAHISIDAR